MREYCEEDTACRHTHLLKYFGEEWAQQRCGDRCDNCLPRQGPGAAKQSKITDSKLYQRGAAAHLEDGRTRQAVSASASAPPALSLQSAPFWGPFPLPPHTHRPKPTSQPIGVVPQASAR